jgi:hypothetical protein
MLAGVPPTPKCSPFHLMSFRDVAKLHGGIFIFYYTKDFSANFVSFEMTKAFHAGTYGTGWNTLEQMKHIITSLSLNKLKFVRQLAFVRAFYNI